MQLSVVAAANMPCEWESSMVDSEWILLINK
jgi:hypothetical protein